MEMKDRSLLACKLLIEQKRCEHTPLNLQGKEEERRNSEGINEPNRRE